MGKKNDAVSAILGAAAVCLVGCSGFLYAHPEQDGIKRQNTEESMAQAYLDCLLARESGEREGSETDEAHFDAWKTDQAAVFRTEKGTGDDLTARTEESSSFDENVQETCLSESAYYVRDGIT